jgi:hypothetical protein
MDGNRFDDLARHLATRDSRRGVLRTFVGMGAGTFLALLGRGASADICKGQGKACSKNSQCCSGICAPQTGKKPVAGSGSVCAPSICVPGTCASLGLECGEASDGCGGTLDCGGCGAGSACGVETPNICTCISPEPPCETGPPEVVGSSCGPRTNNCGDIYPPCSTCIDTQICAADGRCACAPGYEADSNGVCQPVVCTPDCAGKTCGSDGCGGTCGTCSSEQTCSESGACT